MIGDILAIEHDGLGINVDGLDPREDYPKPEPVEQIEDIEISGICRITQIGTLLNKKRRKEMEQFLKRNSDVFTWSTAKMSGIPPSVICHSLNANPMIRPVKQKKRKLGPKRITAIR